MKNSLKEHEFVRGFLTASLIFVFLGVIGFFIYSTVSKSRSIPQAIIDTQNITVQDNLSSRERGTFVDERDGQPYKWVKVGNQEWMTENLAYLPYVNSSYSASATSPQYYVYEYEDTNITAAKATTNYLTYGVLYNWQAACESCPEGWRLPCDEEWKTLTNYLGGEVTAGGKLKDTNPLIWHTPNTGATNESGFAALPGGFRFITGNFYHINARGYWWTASESDISNAWAYTLFYDSTHIQRIKTSKEVGFSVRCVKDNSSGIKQVKTQEIFDNQTISFGFKLEPSGEKEYDDYNQIDLEVFKINLYHNNILFKSLKLGIAYNVYLCMSADSCKLFFVNSGNGSIPHNYSLFKYDFIKDKIVEIRGVWAIAGYFISGNYKNDLLIEDMTWEGPGVSPLIIYYLINEDGHDILRAGTKGDLNDFLLNSREGYIQIEADHSF